MAKKRVKKRVSKSSKVVKSSGKNKISSGLAIAVLILNLIIPGVGSLVGGRTRVGTWQLVLTIVGAILSIILIGIPMVIAAWIWALITSIQLIKEAN